MTSPLCLARTLFIPFVWLSQTCVRSYIVCIRLPCAFRYSTYCTVYGKLLNCVSFAGNWSQTVWTLQISTITVRSQSNYEYNLNHFFIWHTTICSPAKILLTPSLSPPINYQPIWRMMTIVCFLFLNHWSCSVTGRHEIVYILPHTRTHRLD